MFQPKRVESKSIKKMDGRNEKVSSCMSNDKGVRSYHQEQVEIYLQKISNTTNNPEGFHFVLHFRRYPVHVLDGSKCSRGLDFTMLIKSLKYFPSPFPT